jgi:PBP1b-binding outer membrane lipoprotein LpoB
MKTLTVLLAALVLSAALFSGCVGSPKIEKAAPETTQPLSEDISPDEVVEISDSDVPLIEENDTVEIGEMI